MQEHTLDEDVFIRSIGTKGKLGGLSKTINNIIKLYNASNFDLIVIETTGVGQSELDIVKIANITVVVIVPESGDDIQVMKSGLMEVGDIYVVNKCDREGAKRLELELKSSFHQKTNKKLIPPVISTNARTGEGIDKLASTLTSFIKSQHKRKISKSKETQRQLDELLDLILDEAEKRIKKS